MRHSSGLPIGGRATTFASQTLAQETSHSNNRVTKIPRSVASLYADEFAPQYSRQPERQIAVTISQSRPPQPGATTESIVPEIKILETTMRRARPILRPF
jgi:hypothetical protein